MRVLTSIGEIGVTASGRDILFRPSLYAMSQLPDPVATFHSIHTLQSTPIIERDRFRAAIEVLTACNDEDISWLVGRIGRTYKSWTLGKLPVKDIIVLAASLIRHGVTGVVPEEANRPPLKPADYADKFEPRDIVALAVAHLGLSEAEAWNLTVTSFILAMRAKFPPQKAAEQPSKQDL